MSVLKLWRSPDAESLSSMLGHQLTWNRRWTRSQSYFCLPWAWWVVSHGSVNGLIAKSKVTNVVISWQLKSTVALMKFLVKGTDTKWSGNSFKGTNHYWRLLSCLARFMLECSNSLKTVLEIWRNWKSISKKRDYHIMIGYNPSHQSGLFHLIVNASEVIICIKKYIQIGNIIPPYFVIFMSLNCRQNLTTPPNAACILERFCLFAMQQ